MEARFGSEQKTETERTTSTKYKRRLREYYRKKE